jgi:hypothetical protein
MFSGHSITQQPLNIKELIDAYKDPSTKEQKLRSLSDGLYQCVASRAGGLFKESIEKILSSESSERPPVFRSVSALKLLLENCIEGAVGQGTLDYFEEIVKSSEKLNRKRVLVDVNHLKKITAHQKGAFNNTRTRKDTVIRHAKDAIEKSESLNRAQVECLSKRKIDQLTLPPIIDTNPKAPKKSHQMNLSFICN